MKKLLYICFLLFLLGGNIQAQIGINTTSPSATLEVCDDTVGNMYKIFKVSDSSYKELLGIQMNGYIGQGTYNPLVLVDLRGTTGAIGIGYTSTAATDVGAGAIRYNPTLQTLEYSDGAEWVRLQVNSAKAFVIANNSSGQTIPMVSAYTALAGLTNWSTIYDQTTSFDPVNGLFTAPRDGVYYVSATVVLEPMAFVYAGQYELLLQATNNKLKHYVPTMTAGTFNLTNACSALFYLAAGETVYVGVYMNGITTTPIVSTDGSLNMLTIAEM